MKYIIFNSHSDKVIIFSSTIDHCTMLPRGCKAKSAGECRLIDGKICVTSLGSTTLGIKPEKVNIKYDETLLNRELTNNDL